MKDQPGPVVIDEDVVRRPAGPWTPAVHALLDHLERAGFSGSPHTVSADGEDVVTYIPGESVHPHTWSDEGVFRVGRLLRGLHDATASFIPPPGAAWHPWPFASDAPGAIISHRDTGPWNSAAEAIQAGVTPQTADCDALWAITWRARSAAWMVRHRALLENALT